MFGPMNMKIDSPKTKTITLKGGLNTEVANMERGPGELLVSKNYNAARGAYSGYTSAAGYERFDGTPLSTTIPLEGISIWESGSDYDLNDRVSYAGIVFYCKQASGSGSNTPQVSPHLGSNTWWTLELANGSPAYASLDYPNVAPRFESRNRDAHRAANIDVVPGSGDVLGIHVYGNNVYAWRDNAGDTATLMYVAHATTGWTALSGTVAAFGPDSTIDAVTGRFRDFESNAELIFFVDGVTEGFFWSDGTDVTNVTHGNLPTGYAPQKIGIWEGRLFLVYQGGAIYFSNVGDCSDFDSTTGYAGVVELNDEVTGLVPLTGNLVIFTVNGTKVLHYGSTNEQFTFKLDDYSRDTGAVDGTVITHYETIFFCSKRSVSRMMPSMESGGYSMEQLSDKIVNDYLDIQPDINASVMDNSNGRYYAFFPVGEESSAYTFTMYKGRLKGIGKVELAHKVVCTASGTKTDGSDWVLFGDDTGMVYKMESGLDYDGTAIDTTMTTSYYHFGTPRHWKLFQRLTFEMDCENYIECNVTPVFDYQSYIIPSHASEESRVYRTGTLWGSSEAVWGSFTYGAGLLETPILYIGGRGTNMAITMTTSSKVAEQHTIHNVTVDYTQESLRQ